MTARERALYRVQLHAFTAKEMQLFLDTHGENSAAFAELRRALRQEQEATRRYEESFGPLTVESAAREDAYRWTETPWPWEKEA